MICFKNFVIILLSTNIFVTIAHSNDPRKPLKPAAQETVGAIRETVHGALGVVQFKDDQENQKEFDNSLRELATGIANLILAGIHQKQRNEQYHNSEAINELIKEIVAIIKSEIKNLSL